jgi:hypothetical protein
VVTVFAGGFGELVIHSPLPTAWRNVICYNSYVHFITFFELLFVMFKDKKYLFHILFPGLQSMHGIGEYTGEVIPDKFGSPPPFVR